MKRFNISLVVANFPAVLLMAVFLIAGLLVLPGCKPASDGSLDLLDTKVSSLKIDDLSRSMDFLRSERRFDQSEFANKVSSGLNRWAGSEEGEFDDDGWALDDNVEPLIEQYINLPVCKRVGEMSFAKTDAFYAQQCVWMNQIGTRIVASHQLGPFELYRLAAGDYVPDKDDETDDLVTIVHTLHPDLNEEQAITLTSGLKLFDWVCRNIQPLSAENPTDSQLAEGQTLAQLRESLALSENINEDNPAASGIPGPGYTRYVWQTLIYSRGDYLERARLFILMARQMNLQAVMLTTGAEAQPWCPALVVGDELYVFDTLLGLPLPGENPGTIATLSLLKENRELITNLDLNVDESLEKNTRYRINAEELDTLGAQVLVSPESVSRRFFDMNKALGLEEPVQFTDDLSAMLAGIPEFEGLEKSIWDIEFKTHVFRDIVRDSVLESSHRPTTRSKLRWHFANELYIDEFPAYRTSRCRYFRGKFNATTQQDGRGAIQSFFTLMYSDQDIAELGTNINLQRQLGIYQAESEQKNFAEFEMRINSVQGQMQLVRRDAGFFLSECNFDNGNIGTAANWLERMKKTEAMNQWGHGISYLLARAYEGRGEYDRAIEELETQTDSPQYTGNIIRARLLKQLRDME